MLYVEARNVSKRLVSNARGSLPIEVVHDFNLDLSEGDLVTFFGPNGCGKTTILNMLAGLIPPDSGKISRGIRLIADVVDVSLQEITPASARQRALPDGKMIKESPDLDIADSFAAVGYVFQDYSTTLLPWRTVSANVAFPLEVRGLTANEIDARVAKRLQQFRLTEHANKYIYELSGGLKQLVAIARATVYDPRLLLLDEPFSALDFSLSRELWLRFREFWSDQQVATLFVSHDVDESIFLGDRVCVLSARPARLVAEIHVPFGNNRPISLLSSQEFFAVRTQVLEAFEKGRQL